VEALRTWAHEWPGLSIAAVGQWPMDAAKVPGLRIMRFRDPLELQALYSGSRFVLNTLRAEFGGYSHTASARPFEAAVAGSCLVTERFPGLEAFLEPGVECVALDDLRELRRLADLPESDRVAMSARARARVTADCLEAAEELSGFLAGCSSQAPSISDP
jgi:spore maturation protein CgeB